MRSGVIGAMYWKHPEYAFKIGAMSSVPTHNNLEAILGSGLVSFLTAQSISGISWPTAVGDGLQQCYDFEFTIPNELIPDLPRHTDPEIACPQYGILGTDLERPNPWYALGHIGAAFAYASDKDKLQIPAFRKWNGDDNAVIPAVASAVFFNTRFSDFLRIVIAAVNYSGDCDTVGAIAGCFAGARFGDDAIKAEWRARIEQREYLMDLAMRISIASQSIEIKDEESYEIQL